MFKQKNITIYLLSDSLGETAHSVARAAANQYPDFEFNYKQIPFVEDVNYLSRVLDNIDPENSILMFTLVVQQLNDFIKDYCDMKSIPFVDILDTPFSVLTRFTGLKPQGKPGFIQKMDASYFKKIEAIEFAIKYDDGKDTSGLKQADLILLGVSRTSKTPLSMYLAYRGIKVANIPLVPNIKIGDEVYSIPKDRFIGLTIRPDVLNSIRNERLKSLGVVGGSDYTDMVKILDELENAETIMKRVGCPIIDVSHKAIEETANNILQIYFSRGVNIIE